MNNAQQAIDWLTEAHHADQQKEKTIRMRYDEDGMTLEKRSALLDLSDISKTVQNKQRFRTPAVVVVDYAMPGINGIEFCEKIQGTPCKKVLLTGNADEKIAVKAFNDRLIDFFIKKGDVDALSQFEKQLPQLQRDFFMTRTATWQDLLTRHTHAFFSDPAIVLLVAGLYERLALVEHYLFPNPPGILLFNAEGRAWLLVIETEDGFRSQIEIARNEGAPVALIEALEKRTVIPFFHDTNGAYDDVIQQHWRLYCQPAKTCMGLKKYFWALFEYPPEFLHSTMLCYADFLQNRRSGKAAS